MANPTESLRLDGDVFQNAEELIRWFDYVDNRVSTTIRQLLTLATQDRPATAGE